ncbi:MAG: threonine--tRNA ligase [Candidatus Aenigmarchaeota archaeon ex4484_56]|nr:MAG: threonine--tRNA ligase [Candidatus Aenigmarchaeota archaeon ex4484_56]
MRILLIHSNKLEYKIVKKALKNIENTENKENKLNNCLVVFWAVEEDDKNIEQITEEAFKEIKNVAGQIDEKTVILYPYVHLLFGSKPADKETALEIEKKLEEKLKKEFEVYKAPFGYYKSFKIECKGHPLSELSRVIKGKKTDEISEALKKEETIKSKWYILEPSGKLSEIKLINDKVEGFDFSNYQKLEKLVKYEMKKSRKVDIEPPHIKLMRKLEIADYEPGSDPGNLRYYPKGRLIKSLLEEWVTKKVIEYGGMEIETPIMYDFNHPSLKKYLNRFPARQYRIETPNKKVFLRFSACFGQFLMAHDINISYKNLPVRLYELTRYSFRVEQRGELAGLRRLRAFTMPDCHAFCKDIEQAKEELIKRYELSKNIQEGIGFSLDDFEVALRIVKDFYEKNKEFVNKFVQKIGKPILVEMWEEKFFYFIFKYEFNFIDALDKAAALTTDQFDIENAKTYDITYIDSDGKRKYPVILHLSPSGAIERVIYAILERAYMQQKDVKNPVLPLWLSPIQVRLCSVADNYIDFAEKIADRLEKENIRVEIDDRTESIQKKIRGAETDWVPLIIVVGEKEKNENKFPVRFREDGKIKNMDIDEIISYIKEKTENKPFKSLPIPRKITKQVKFVG